MERTVLVMTPHTQFVGKLHKMIVGYTVKDVCLCNFVNVQTRDSVAQIVALRRVGSIEDFKITDDMIVIDLERDSDIYLSYMKQITGISITGDMPPSPHKN